jgi:hypothetical protein
MKYPTAGKVKTRLGRRIGMLGALRLYEKLLRRTLGIAADAKRLLAHLDLFLFYDPPHRGMESRESYPGPWNFVPQAPGHLGEKMRAAFRYARERGYRQVALIGSDVADLASSDIAAAFQGLEKDPVVLGPARDGGFYLIGLSVCSDVPFRFESWSTPSVYDRTRAVFRKAGLSVKRLPMRRDVDREEDLTYLQEQPFFREQVSIIIPFLTTSRSLAALIQRLETQLWPDDEILLVKGCEHHRGFRPEETHLRSGHWDASSEFVTPRSRLVLAPKGRGIQQNRGAREARGSLLWFHHADCLPPQNFGYHLRKLSHGSRFSVGCFALRFLTERPALQWISQWANFRARVLKLPYGDQGLFCQRHMFDRVGGFQRAYLMEDVEFVRKSRKLGQLLFVPEPMYASPRKYLQKGILLTSFQNHLLILLHLMGVRDKRLYAIYYRSSG